MFRRSYGSVFASSVIIFAVVFLVASCGGDEPETNNPVRGYYLAIEEDDADTAASFFAENALIVTPSGNVISGVDEISSQFIPYDLQFMDRVEFLTDFTESDEKISWSQAWHHVDGDSFVNDCEITMEDGKIVEWHFG